MRCFATLLLIAPACVLGFSLTPIAGTNRLAILATKGRALFMAADVDVASPEAAVQEAEPPAKAEADVAKAVSEKAEADKKAEAEAAAEKAAADKKAKAEAAAEKAAADKKAKAEAAAEKAAAEAAKVEAAAASEAEAAKAAAAVEAEQAAAEQRAEAEREALRAGAKAEIEAEIEAARAPRPRVQVGDELPAISVTSYVKSGKGGKLTTSLLGDAMGDGTSIVVGMPGACVSSTSMRT